MEVTNHPTSDATTHVVDDEPFVNRGWFTTADGRKNHEQISSSKGQIGTQYTQHMLLTLCFRNH